MKSISIGAAWLEASAFLRRESALWLPVALLFVTIPTILFLQAIPPEWLRMAASGATEPPPLPASSALTMALSAVTVLTGSLALYALAVKPGISVAEALRLGLIRLPVSIATSLLMGVALLLPVTLVTVVFLPLGSLALLAGAFFLSARLLLLNPAIVDRKGGPVAMLGVAWALGRGRFPRFLAYTLALALMISLADTVAQSLLGLVGVVLGGAELGRSLALVGSGLVVGLGQMVKIAMDASLYRQAVRTAA